MAGKVSKVSKGKSVRSRVNTWARVPAGATEAEWNLFLACGHAVAQEVGERRGPWAREGEGTALLELLKVGAPQAPEAPRSQEAPPSPEHQSANPVNRDEELSDYLAQRRRRRRDDEERGPFRRAFHLLTNQPQETFSFLGAPGDPEPLPLSVLLTALLCSKYVLSGSTEPVGNLRAVFTLFQPLPSGWEPLGKSLVRACRRKGSWLDLRLSPESPSALDGAVFLSPAAFESLLGFVPPPVATDREARREARMRNLQRAMRGGGPKRQEEEEPSMARLSSPKLGLDDLALPPALKQELALVVALCKKRPTTAPTLLFHGPPGTGKTHAAAVLAGATERRLATASLAQLHDKYVGETEKHLEQVFQEAARANAVLLLDEADALLHSRESAQRSWEVSWVNALLKLLEKPSIPVILCTNFADKLDPAVHRRIHHMIAFPVPAAPERRSIWVRELRLAHIKVAVDIERLGEVPLSGGLIANAVRQARARRDLLGRSFALTTASLLELAHAERPKMTGAAAELRRVVGFGQGRDLA